VGDQSFKHCRQSIRSEADTIAVSEEVSETGIIELTPVIADRQKIGKFSAMTD
jgi:hypothetical protein